MKLSIKRITPFVVAGGLILTGCNRTNDTINENNIDNDSRPSMCLFSVPCRLPFKSLPFSGFGCAVAGLFHKVLLVDPSGDG